MSAAPLYAMGDIHGHLEMLEDALARIEAEGGRDARVIFLGDLVDRGPDSAGVIDLLIRGLAEGRNWVVIKGNHDRMFQRFVTAGIEHDDRIESGLGWRNHRLGGSTTLASYGVGDPGSRPLDEVLADARARVPQAHLDFIGALPLFHREEGLLFVHAGLRPGLAIEDQDEDDLLWIREGFLEQTCDFGALVVHGHTAIEYPAHYGNRVNLDGGAGRGRSLWPAVFDSSGVWLLDKGGRVPLDPLPQRHEIR